MLTNPFDSQNDEYQVLINDEGQHCLWPGLIDIPAGWTSVYGAADRSACLEYVNAAWTDLRPRSLVAHLDAPPVITRGTVEKSAIAEVRSHR